MKVVQGRVEQGCVVVDEDLPEGAAVTVLVASGIQEFDLDEDQISALEDSIAEADRGDLVSAENVLNSR